MEYYQHNNISAEGEEVEEEDEDDGEERSKN